MTRKFVCIVCPNSCELEATVEEGVVTDIKGGLCDRGRKYVKNELLHPVRTVTTLIRIRGGEMPLASVRLDNAIEKEKMLPLVSELKKIELDAPVTIGQIVMENVYGSGANVIITKNVKAIKEAGAV